MSIHVDILSEYPDGEIHDEDGVTSLAWVFVDLDGVYIGDDLGEIVSWNEDEIQEDPSIGMVIANALIIFFQDGGDVLRDRIDHPIRREI